jgi:hypothetical protein
VATDNVSSTAVTDNVSSTLMATDGGGGGDGSEKPEGEWYADDADDAD